MNKQTLDFIVIGAAKAGTTTLFRFLNKHPDVYLPSQKEIPFFTEDRQYRRGVDYLLNKVYGKASMGSILGKITPQYMSGQGDNNPETVAGRINSSVPNVKIIAILRDPIERGLSHYKMSMRNGYEKRSYTEAVNELLRPQNLEYARRHQNWTNSYVVGGEYGRILQYYYDQFDRSQMLVLFTSDLRDAPGNVLRRLLNFIGANEDYTPENINTRFNVGGSEARLKLLTPGYIYKIPFVQYIWQNLVPFTARRHINQAIGNWNIAKDSKEFSIDNKTKAKLVDHFKEDAKLLELLIAAKPPWVF